MTAGLKTGGYIYCLIVFRRACRCDLISLTCCCVSVTPDALVAVLLDVPAPLAVPVEEPVAPEELPDVEPVGVPVVEPLVPVVVPLEAPPPLASFRIRSMAAMCDSTSLPEIAEPEVEPVEEVVAPGEPAELVEPVDEALPAASPPAAL